MKKLIWAILVILIAIAAFFMFKPDPAPRCFQNVARGYIKIEPEDDIKRMEALLSTGQVWEVDCNELKDKDVPTVKWPSEKGEDKG